MLVESSQPEGESGGLGARRGGGTEEVRGREVSPKESTGDDAMIRTVSEEVEPVAVDSELAELSAGFEWSPPTEIISWAVERFGSRLSLASSFQDLVIVDLALQVEPKIEVLFLETGAHFPETLAFVEEMRDRLGINLTLLHPGPEAEAWPCGSARCCEFRKVAPLRAHLADRDAWMTGLRRAEAPTRATAPIVGLDPGFGVVKINPLATWTDEDVAGYLRDHELPVHPLTPQGYLSIGCEPTTSPVSVGQHSRAGRWAGLDKTECGLHG
jgi:phosphoadenosine phosphosulfate reductase